jgi:hypothetical protein
MKTFKVTATIVTTAYRFIDAEDEEDAIDQSNNVSPEEWREGFTVQSEHVETLDAHQKKK